MAWTNWNINVKILCFSIDSRVEGHIWGTLYVSGSIHVLVVSNSEFWLVHSAFLPFSVRIMFQGVLHLHVYMRTFYLQEFLSSSGTII